MNLDHKIFNSRKERNRWYNQMDYYLNKPDLDENVKVEVIEALLHLKSEFKKEFLKSSHLHHPLHSKIANKALHSIKWIIWLSQSLKAIKTRSINYQTLIM